MYVRPYLWFYVAVDESVLVHETQSLYELSSNETSLYLGNGSVEM